MNKVATTECQDICCNGSIVEGRLAVPQRQLPHCLEGVAVLSIHGYMNEKLTAVNAKDPVRGFAGMPRNMTGIATKLREAGYRTHATGLMNLWNPECGANRLCCRGVRVIIENAWCDTAAPRCLGVSLWMHGSLHFTNVIYVGGYYILCRRSLFRII